jgi:DnaJ-class molecular chaperone
MKFFVKPYTIESIKKQFRELSKKLHPDVNGDSVLFVEMQKEKDNLMDAINKHIPSITPKKKKVLKKVKYKHIHIVVDGNDIMKQFFKQLKKWN